MDEPGEQAAPHRGDKTQLLFLWVSLPMPSTLMNEHIINFVLELWSFPSYKFWWCLCLIVCLLSSTSNAFGKREIPETCHPCPTNELILPNWFRLCSCSLLDKILTDRRIMDSSASHASVTARGTTWKILSGWISSLNRLCMEVKNIHDGWPFLVVSLTSLYQVSQWQVLVRLLMKIRWCHVVCRWKYGFGARRQRKMAAGL